MFGFLEEKLLNSATIGWSSLCPSAKGGDLQQMMTNWGVEVLSPASAYFADSDWCRSGFWTPAENKVFENALARVDINRPDRWEQVAAFLPGKTVTDVINHYHDLEDDVSHIEAGLIPDPGYNSSPFMLDWENSLGFDGLKHPYSAGGKRVGGRLSDQERKKGIPWTEEEHRQFLLGLKMHGRGDWRNIAKNFVTSKTPTQVASHAQKYFIRQSSSDKDKRRSSIHDMNLPDDNASSPSYTSSVSTQSSTIVTPGTPDKYSLMVNSSKRNEATRISSTASSQMHLGRFMQTPYGVTPYELKLHIQSPNNSVNHIIGNHNVFQMLSSHLHHHG